jgi:hypothetical protein
MQLSAEFLAGYSIFLDRPAAYPDAWSINVQHQTEETLTDHRLSIYRASSKKKQISRKKQRKRAPGPCEAVAELEVKTSEKYG